MIGNRLSPNAHLATPVRAVLSVGGVPPSSSPTFALTAGSHQLAPVFATAAGEELGAYYVIVTARSGG